MTLRFLNIISSLASSVFGALIVTLSNHSMAFRWEREKITLDARVKRLSESWMEIQPTGCVPDHLNKDQKNRNYDELDQSITKVILIFDLSKVEAAKKIVRDVTARSNATIRDLLKSLRDSLREKLKLERAELLVLFFRLKRELP